MSTANDFNLESSMFSTCSGKWDKKTKSFHPANATEIFKCCLENCQESLKFCHQYCEDNQGTGKKFYTPELLSRCLGSCDIQRKECLETCRLSAPNVGTNNSYILCANEYGCEGIDGVPIPECARKKKEQLFRCCRDKCTQLSNLDCNSHCKFLESIALNRHTIGLPKIGRQTLSELVNDFPPPRSDCTKIYVIAAVIGSMAVALTILIIVLSMQKN